MEDIHLLRILWIFVSSFGPMPWFRTHAQTSSAPQPIRQRSQPLASMASEHHAEKTPTVTTRGQADGWGFLFSTDYHITGFKPEKIRARLDYKGKQSIRIYLNGSFGAPRSGEVPMSALRTLKNP
ncbi:conserved hypothetical protein [Histoplasma capsulatum var. duboisii H88]|uniref:Uncharacterized protein n=2 Tax=Ajellomyces capsulatus TaxID=5037 RepID=F0UFJ1_AJEC8|nr:conserved hypothetical protein [Histoplasma capsulatum H143]EGC44151.1 conserved hypothetical protein [Histoplasma capsulatum var. duboisii H88]